MIPLNYGMKLCAVKSPAFNKLGNKDIVLVGMDHGVACALHELSSSLIYYHPNV